MDDDERLPKTLDRRIHVPFVLLLFFFLLFYAHSTSASEIELLNTGIVLIAMFFAAFVLESRYVVWVGVLPNILLLYMITELEWRNVSMPFKIYVIGGFFLGVLSFIQFYGKVMGPSKTTIYGNKHPVYKATYVLYSLKTVFPFYFSYFMLKSFAHPFYIYSFLVVFIIIWFFYMIEGI
jgi:hypothetical protein